jgi:hypothetical protein
MSAQSHSIKGIAAEVWPQSSVPLPVAAATCDRGRCFGMMTSG